MRLAILACALLMGACSAQEPARGEAAAETVSGDQLAAPAKAAGPASRASQFTKLDDSNCKTVSEDKETGDWSGSCPGVGPYRLEWSIGDLRDDLEVIRGDTRTRLNIPGIVAGGAFDSIGETLEWRGRPGEEPDVLVARVHVARPDGTSDRGRLTVIRLGVAPCIVAIVPPVDGQSDKARAIADSDLPACLAD